MPNITSQRFGAPQFTPGDGCAAFMIDRAVVSSNFSAGETIRFSLPAGIEWGMVEIQCDDLDSNATPTIAFSVGYAPTQLETIYTAAPTYFSGTGQTTMRTGGRLICSFPPIKFEEDMALVLTIGTAAATFAAGSVWAICCGAARGLA